MKQQSLFGLSEQLEKLSEHGDPLEVLDATVDLNISGAGWLKGLATVMEPRAGVRRLIQCRCSRH